MLTHSADAENAGERPSAMRALEAALATARPRLLRLARLRGVPADLAEDVVQETLLEAWRCLDRLYDPAGVAWWLDEICRNVCRRYARRQASEQRHLALSPTLDDEDDDARESGSLRNIPGAEDDDPLAALDHQETALLLDRALGMLSGHAREAVELCYLREVPQREATDRLGLSLSALEARLHRARRQLRALFNGPLRDEAEAFGLALDDASAEGWQETRLWCSLCGRRRLFGLFLVQPDGSLNLHMRCPDCEQRHGLNDIDGSSIHSKGMVRLDRLRSFRPAWKRTMQAMTQQLTQGLLAGEYHCPFCGGPAALRLVDKAHLAAAPDGLARHPYQFWAQWLCPREQCGGHAPDGLFAASDLVYWSQPQAQRFMREHPRWISEPELLVEYAGRPALRLQMADTASAARLTVLADRQNLRMLAVH